MLWWLANFLSSAAFKDYKTIDDIFSVRPPDGETFWMLDWDDSALKRPVFPQWTVEGRVEVPKNAKAWGNDASDWAKRAGYFGLAIHAVRREILIRVNGETQSDQYGPDSGASIGQVLKFAAQKNPSVLGNHYLHDLTTVDGASCYLGMKPRTDLTEDFRTATMRRNPDVGQSLPSSMRHELRQRDEYVLITNNIEDLNHQIKKTVDEDKLRELKTDRATAYRQRDILEKEELTKLREHTKRVHPAQRGQQHQGDGQHRKKDETEFDRIRHMMPERDRLSRTLFLRVSIRSPEGRSAMQDLINLRTQDSQVAYQEVLKPNKGCCPVGYCGRQMKDIPIAKRWDHVFRCQQNELMKEHSYAKFCFIPTCSTWITSETAWHAHCQDHIDKNDLPFKCDPVKFRRAVACAGYCPFHLGDRKATAAERMQSFPDRSAWQRHISCCSSRAKHCPDESEEATHVSSGDNDVYTVDCLLDKWSNWFFVRWFDGSCTWEPRENIRDNELIRKLNKEHGGLKWGVEVLQARRESRGVRYLVRWKGGKWKDQWVAERYMCRELIEEHRPEKKVKRRRKT
ncbi:hypothetical protein GE09DRAFT_1021124 [Coniochaeta sp. 2T2.1]|nr:hypothetical protein GE09DRAFT_1021124 [Coniochaeta sp. 2T2.1]